MERRFDDHVVARAVWRRAERYAHPGLQLQFLRQVMSPPTYESEGPDGRALLLRRTGSGWYYPFWHGFDGVGRKPPAATGSGVAFMAGRLRRQLEDAGRLPRIGALKVDPTTGRLVPGQAVPGDDAPEAEAAPAPGR